MFKLLLKLDEKTRKTLDGKLAKLRTVTGENVEYEAGQIRNYVSLIARTAYELGQQDAKLPIQGLEDIEENG